MRKPFTSLAVLAAVVMLGGEIAAADCTIGVASPGATADGRPLIWKTRDRSDLPRNQVYWSEASAAQAPESENRYSFLAIADEPADETDTTSTWPRCCWMGVNEAGFGIVNSLSEDLDTRAKLGNGNLIIRALGDCASVEAFDTLVACLQAIDTLKQAHGNFAVLDSSGDAAIFEIGPDTCEVFYADSSADGFLVRTNFSQTGGGYNGRGRYERSRRIISDLVSENSLDYSHLIRRQFRDLSLVPDEDRELPFAGHARKDLPYGYVPCDSTICRSTSISAVAIRGIVRGEAGWQATMWTILGPPAGGIAVPYFPVGPAPEQACSSAPNLYERALQTRDAVIYPRSAKRSDPPKSFDTFALAAGDVGLWPQIEAAEDSIVAAYRGLLSHDSTHSSVSRDQLRSLQEQLAEQAVQSLAAATLDTAVTADFDADVTEGCGALTVHFRDRSRHGPEKWIWHFGDGDSLVTTTPARECEHRYSEPGTYTVALRTQRGTSHAERVRENYVTVYEVPAAASQCTASADRCGVLVRWSDQSDCEQGFRIYRNGVLIDSVDPDSTRFLDTPPTVETYAYSVVAYNQDCAAQASNTAQGHAAGIGPPGAPELEYPSAGADCIASDCPLTWQSGEEVVLSRVVVSRAADGALLLDSTLAAEELAIQLEPAGGYAWSVVDSNACGWGDTARGSFSTSPHPLVLPGDLIAARPGSTSDSLVFSWTPTASASIYEVRFGAACEGLLADPVDARLTSDCQLAVPRDLLIPQATVWGVRPGACTQLTQGIACLPLAPVTVEELQVATSPVGAELEWTVFNDTALAGFRILRISASGARDTLNHAPIPVSAGGYAYCDSSADLSAEDEYLLLGCTPQGREIPLARTVRAIPAAFAILSVRPNPFRAQVTFELSIPPGQRPVLEIYDVAGRRVRNLSRGLEPAGVHQVAWNGCDQAGCRVPAGIYFAIVGTGDLREVHRLALIR